MNSISLSIVAGILLPAGLGWLGISTEKAGRDAQSKRHSTLLPRTFLGHVTPGPLLASAESLWAPAFPSYHHTGLPLEIWSPQPILSLWGNIKPPPPPVSSLFFLYPP